MANWNDCYPFVLGNEDYDPPRYEVEPDPTEADPEAQVISGINSAAYPADFAVIVALPPAERPAAVEAFYQRTYWNQWLSALASSQIAAMVMDSEVNQGAGTGVKILQQAVNATQERNLLAVDGIWGNATLECTNECVPAQLIAAFVERRLAVYAATKGTAQDHQVWAERASKIPSFPSNPVA